MKNVPYAATVHFKDFYIRPYYENPGEGEWFRTVHNNYIRGAIVGHGDINIREIIKLVKAVDMMAILLLSLKGWKIAKLVQK